METQYIEYKSSWHDDYLKWVCGFANANGGTLYIGRNDAGKVIGLANARDLMESLPNKIRESMGLVVDINILLNENLEYLEIIVPAHKVAISLRGRYYYRSGNTNLELTGPALADFLLKKTGKTWDDVAEPEYSLSDIDPDCVERFFDVAKGNNRLPDESKHTSLLAFLENLRLMENGKLKRAAVLLFGKDPRKQFINAFAKLGRFGEDETDLLFQDVIESDSLSLPGKLIELLELKYFIRKVSYQGLVRIEKSSYPLNAIREVLLNAIVHRDYVSAPIQIKVYNDKIEVWNPGSLPTGMTIADLEMPHTSRPQNPNIADVFFKAGLIETWGRGTLRAIRECESLGLPKPVFELNSGGILVTVYLQSDPKEKLISLGLNKREIKAVEFLYKEESMNSKDYEALNNVSKRTAQRELAHLVELGVFGRSGAASSVRYHLITPQKQEIIR